MDDSRPQNQKSPRLVRAQADPALPSAPTNTQLIFNSTYEFIGLLRLDGTVLEVNQPALDFVGVTLADVKDLPFVDTPWWSRDAEGRAHLQAGIAVAARGEFVRFETQHHNARGDAITVDFSLNPICDEQGKVVLLVPEGRDITTRKQSEVAMQQAYDELERKVQERTAALTRAIADLQAEVITRKQNEADALFMAQLNTRIRRDGEAETLTSEVACAVGEYLQVQRCFFTENDLAHDRFIIHQEYCDNVPALAGSHTISAFNAIWGELASTGQTLVLRDAANDARTMDYEIYQRLGIGAFISVPLMREGQMVAGLSVTTTQARAWQPCEITIIETAAELTWQLLEKLRIETVLLTNEARFAGIINSAMDAIITINEAQDIVLFNPAAERMFGYPAAAMIGQSLERLLPASLRVQHAQHIRQFGATGMTARAMGALEAVKGVRQNGEEFPIEAAISQMESEGQKLYTVILRDITRRKSAEEKIREQALLLHHAREAILVLDTEGQIIFWNAGAERLYGWRPDEVLGRKINDQIFRDQNTRVEEARQIFRATGEWMGEIQQFTKDGRAIMVESHITQVRDEAGHTKSILIINTDITEKKQLEQQYLRAQRMESLGTLAGGIAHDLNNILSPLTMGVQMLQTRHPDPFSQKMLGIMATNTERGAAMIKQILSFARGASGEHIAVQPQHLVKELVKLMRETFPKEISIHQQLSDDLWLVEGDPTQLHQVLMNLCVNARDAMPGGGKLTLSAANETLDELSARMMPEATAGNYVTVTVTDTGEGIAREHLDHIFDPFFTTKAQGKGTGLGLATVYGIVKAHAGFIKVYSELGQGTQFKLYLPSQTAPQHAPAQDTTLTSAPLGNGEWILIVDDEASIREITRSALEAFGYHVLTATDGVEAISLYAQHQAEVRLVLTDMMMPLMDGPTLIRTLQKMNPQVLVVGSSGLTEEGKATEARALGVNHILAKPYNAELLLHTIAQALRGNV